MNDHLRIAVGQIDFHVGDIAGNCAHIVSASLKARSQGNCHAIVFPELALTGYPPEDLLLRPAFIDQAERELAALAHRTRGITVVVGHPLRRDGRLYNAASVLSEGAIVDTYLKQHLPNYGVFDEKRYFASGTQSCVFDLDGVAVGVTICEDIWEPGPVRQAVDAGAQLVLNLNGSPYSINRGREREEMVCARAREGGAPVLYVNLLGGQDELVFDGGSFCVDGTGEVACRWPAFEEDIYVAAFDRERGCVPVPGMMAEHRELEDSVYNAVVLGVRDYIEKNGFPGAVVGLSGGIDSALTLAITVDAIGADRVEAVLMPSRYTQSMSLEDARTEAEALGVRYHVVSIEPMFEAFLEQLAPVFGNLPPDVTEENIQARCRGVVLMALSNKKRRIVITTGNKSEMAVGYATLYGDMAGGFSAIKDVPKTLVYRLGRYRNAIAPVIPQRVLTRPPSAELAAEQTDQDSLPAYEILDPILQLYIEEERSPDDIVAAGFDADIVKRVVRLVDLNEYKRRQAAPGVRITRKAFGRDRRYPITSGYR